MARNPVKEQREIRTADKELKAIHAIQKALDGFDSQEAGRVLTFCIDRARQDFERGLKAQVGEAAVAAASKTRKVIEEPSSEAAPSPLPVPETVSA